MTPASRAVLVAWRADLDSLDTAIAALEQAVRALPEAASDETRDAGAVATARSAFRVARRRFKRVELALEYYAPTTSRELNGPPIPEVEETEGPETVLPPTGFQVVEAALFADDAATQRQTLLMELETMRALMTRARTMFGPQETTDAHVWDAARLELSRVLVLGLAGFDAAETGDALPEAVAALDGIARTLHVFRAARETVGAGPTAADTALSRTLADAQRALREAIATGSLNYLQFVVRHGQPAALALVAARTAAGIGLPADQRAFRMTAASLFDRDAFDLAAFAPPGLDRAPAARVALGRALFADGRLSGGRGRSCQSCHDPARAFTDGRPRALALDGSRLRRNTPTVINSGVQVGHFADLRTTYLEDQIADVVRNPLEMHGDLTDASRLLANDAPMAAQFRAAFPGTDARDSLVTPLRIRQALAAYLRDLTRLDSPVDRALRGDTLALSADARAGLSLYMGKARCGSCHFLPLTGGTVPPMYQRSELEVLGVPSRPVTQGAVLDADPGRFAISRAEPHRGAFRTPSLRNVALTAPYMHNGVYRTLDEVITFYDRGGGVGIGAEVPNQTLAPTPLRLTAIEKRQLTRLLEALTDTTALR